MEIKIPIHLLEQDIHMPELVVKGKNLISILERYSNYLTENKNKMNKKVLKEAAVSPEQQTKLMSFSVGIEKSVLNLYEYVTTEVKDPELINLVSKLKTYASEFTNVLERNDNSGSEEETKQPLEQPDHVVEESIIQESKNKPKKITSPWVYKVDLLKEWTDLEKDNQLQEAYTKSKTVKQFISKLKSHKDNFGKILSENEMLRFENVVSDFNVSNDVDEFNECVEKLVEWADSNKVNIKY